MSWHGGDYIMRRLRDACLEAKIDEEQRRIIYSRVLKEIEAQDGGGFDSMGEDPVYDEVIQGFHPWLLEEEM